MRLIKGKVLLINNDVYIFRFISMIEKPNMGRFPQGAEQTPGFEFLIPIFLSQAATVVVVTTVVVVVIVPHCLLSTFSIQTVV